MKSWLPHLCYLSLLLGGGWYLRRTLERENQQVAFLNRPTEETFALLHLYGHKLKEDIRETSSKYVNKANLYEAWRTLQADSITESTLAGKADRKDYLNSLTALSPGRSELVEGFVQDLPLEVVPNLSNPEHFVLKQNDSVRTQLAFLRLLNDAAYRTGGVSISCYFGIPIVASYTMLCPSVSQPCPIEVFLSIYPADPEVMELRINDESFPIKDGMAHFQHSFPKPGIYPLKVIGRSLRNDWFRDSVIVTEKTFFLHVNR